VCRGKYSNSLSQQDVEDILHAKYADNRIVNEDYKLNGATEWFRPGGSLTSLLPPWTGVFLPYVTLHSLVQDLLENKTLDLTTPPQNGSYQNKFGYYFVGLEVLVMLGYVQRTKSVILPGNKEDVLLIGSKLSVSERAVDDIKNNYIIYLSTTLGSSNKRK
jgi:hypothetical protein